MPNYNAKNHLGKVFGKLKVSEYAGVGKFRRTLWKCLCECGNVIIVNSNALVSGNTKSCGCLVKESNSLPLGQAGLNKVFATYKKRAKSKNLVFTISLKDFKRLTSLDCFYCGEIPQLISRNGKQWKPHGNYVYNGLDRVDNSLGYTLDNVVPCCSTCNKAKLTMGYSQFIDWILKVSDNVKAKSIQFASVGK
jgi:hypothetical protein